MRDTVDAASYALKFLKKSDGVVIIVEPFANEKIEDNLNPLGRLFYAASSMSSLDIGAQAGESKIAEVVEASEFTHSRCAT